MSCVDTAYVLAQYLSGVELAGMAGAELTVVMGSVSESHSLEVLEGMYWCERLCCQRHHVVAEVVAQ